LNRGHTRNQYTKKIMDNVDNQPSDQAHESSDGSLSNDPTPKSCSWDAYDAWNQLLFNRYYNAKADGQYVYIDIDDEEVKELQVTFSLANYTDVIKSTLDPRKGHLLDAHIARLDDWQSKGAKPPPPFIAVLAFFCLVAQYMRTDEKFHSNNYYDRLTETLLAKDRTKEHREDIRVGFAGVLKLWQQLDTWLRQQGGHFGLSSARPMSGFIYVGYGISQALLRASDRQKLPEFFAEYSLEPGREIPPADMERLMDDWIHRSTFSQAAHSNWRNTQAKRRMAEVATLELRNWDGSIPGTSETGLQVISKTQIVLESQLWTGPKPRLLWYIVFNVPKSKQSVTYDTEEGDSRGLPIDGKYMNSITVHRGLIAPWSEPIQNISIADFLVNNITMKAQDMPLKAIWLLKKVIVLAWDDEQKLYRSQKHLEFGHRSMLVVYKSIAEKVQRVVSEVDSGSMRMVPDHWGVPQDWVVFEDVKLVGIPDVGNNQDLFDLVPSIFSSIEWNGGLSLPGRRQWLSSRLPTLIINSMDKKLSVVIEDQGTTGTANHNAHTFKSTSTSLEINVASLGLKDGSYGLTVAAVEGDKLGEEIARRYFEVRSPDSPVRSIDYTFGHRSDLLNWTLSAGTLIADAAEKAQILVMGAFVSTEIMLPTTIARLPNKLGAIIGADQEDTVGPVSSPKRMLEGGIVCLNSAHHWYIETVDDNRKLQRGFCIYCGLSREFPGYKPPGYSKIKNSTTKFGFPVASPLPAPAPGTNTSRNTSKTISLATSSDSIPGYDYDGLLDACFTLGEGTWSEFELLARQVSADPAFSYNAIQLFSALGYIDVELDFRWVYPRNWKVSPPVIAVLEPERALFSGRRTYQLLRLLGDQVKQAGGSLDAINNSFGPTSYFIKGMKKGHLQEIADKIKVAINIKVAVVNHPAESIASQLTPLFKILKKSHCVQPAAVADVFDVAQATWKPSKLMEDNNLYRSLSIPRQYYLQNSGTCYRISYRCGKHLAAKLNQTSILAYERLRKELFCPLGAQLPDLYERVAVLCSGLPPVVDVTNHQVIYTQVSDEVAVALWNAIYGS